MELKYIKLLECLSEDSFVTRNALVQEMHVSEKTVRCLLKDLDEYLKEHGSGIEQKYGKGYRLAVYDRDRYTEAVKLPDQRGLPDTSDQRTEYLLSEILTTDGYLKVEDLCDMLFVSRKTISSDLKQTESQLRSWGLRMERRPYYGVGVTGREFDFRLCLGTVIRWPNRYLEKKIGEKLLDERMVSDWLSESLFSIGYSVYEAEFQDIVLQTRIALYRMEGNHIVSLDEIEGSNILRERDIQAAEYCAQCLKPLIGKELPAAEVKALAIHLSGKRNAHVSQTGNMVIDMEINRLVNQILEYVYEMFHLDFTGDFDLQTSLRKHMVALRIRLKYHLNLQNPMLKEIKEVYSFPYVIAAQASTVLSKHFDTIVPEEEIGYLAFCFALSLERGKKQKYKRNIVLVCATGGGSAKLFEYRFREVFGEYLGKVTVCSSYNLEKLDLTDTDCVFSTVPVECHVPVPVYQIQYFLNAAHINRVKRILGNMGNRSIVRYFSPDLFFTGIEAGSKEEVLDMLCSYIGERRELPKDFRDEVFKRENIMQTDLYPLIAIPHPYHLMTRETFVCVAILKRPIHWHVHEVQVVFLMSISSNQENLEDFYEIAPRFMMDPACIQQLIQEKRYETLVEIIRKTEENRE